ncbi:unnamed protein product [Euphydryas editha]|uniref:Uncharacterized protein n=1 Tax=Euphydryas editha TaxID=104508 RepID=A0AAU9UNQ8_EUPED|nr:unnamed protein product [Euphydryas editha]
MRILPRDLIDLENRELLDSAPELDISTTEIISQIATANEPTPSCSSLQKTFSPLKIRPLPKAPPRKTNTNSRRNWTESFCFGQPRWNDRRLKSESRGSSRVSVTENDELALTKWFDNKPVLFLSSVEEEETELLKYQPSISAAVTVKRKLRFSEVYSDSDEKSQEPNEVSVKNIKPGVFILVKIIAEGKKKTEYKYAAICQSTVSDDEGEVRVMFLKMIDKNAKSFISNETDVSDVPFENIITILPNPTLQNRGIRTYYNFDHSIDIFEK